LVWIFFHGEWYPDCLPIASLGNKADVICIQQNIQLRCHTEEVYPIGRHFWQNHWCCCHLWDLWTFQSGEWKTLSFIASVLFDTALHTDITFHSYLYKLWYDFRLKLTMCPTCSPCSSPSFEKTAFPMAIDTTMKDCTSSMIKSSHRKLIQIVNSGNQDQTSSSIMAEWTNNIIYSYRKTVQFFISNLSYISKIEVQFLFLLKWPIVWNLWHFQLNLLFIYKINV